MASADLKKHLRGYVLNGIAAHNFRTKENHSNKDIRPELTPFNRHYGPQTKEEFLEKFKAMVAAMDEKHPPKRKKKDRKEGLGVLISSPREGMSPEDEAMWSEAAFEVMLELFPDQVVGGTYHADEVHTYIDPDDHLEHVSRGHTHIELIPWTETKGLNMDEFYKRTLPNKINEALDAKCQELFGFPFRNGTGAKSRGSVERMKQKSLEAQIEKTEADLTNKLYATQEAQEALDVLEDKKTDAKSDLEALRGECEAMKEELAEAKSAFARFMEKVADWVRSHEGLRKVLQGSPLLSKVNRAKIERRMEETVERGGKAILEASESVEDLLAAEKEVERGKRTFDTLKAAAKKDLDPDDLEDGWER